MQLRMDHFTLNAGFGLLSTAGKEKAAEPRSATHAELLALFNDYRGPLLRYLLRFTTLPVHECEDVVQEAFLALHRHLKADGPRQNLAAWLFRVVRNIGLKRLGAQRKDWNRAVPIVDAPENSVKDPGPTPEDHFAFKQEHETFQTVLAALPELDRQCLALRAEGLRYREIAGVLDVSLGAVAKSLEKSLGRITRATQAKRRNAP